ncbi:MAG: hypothetical protein CMJ18_04480 [Phycisphaeraceae bacterium]|nr:hypothetical protein [Phycisphaeraceae bacterium]
MQVRFRFHFEKQGISGEWLHIESYVLSEKAVHLTVMGLREVDRFCAIAAALAERAVLTPEERVDLENYGAELLASGKLK